MLSLSSCNIIISFKEDPFKRNQPLANVGKEKGKEARMGLIHPLLL